MKALIILSMYALYWKNLSLLTQDIFFKLTVKFIRLIYIMKVKERNQFYVVICCMFYLKDVYIITTLIQM